ncbi:MAG: class I SAM-dependent methyltransferase [Promethearchaeota archaeon]
MKKCNYDDKKKREMEHFSLKKKKTFFTKIFHLPIFYDPKRDTFNYVFSKRQMERFVNQKLKGKKVENMLIAPCGSGNDYEYLGKFSKNVYGIDLSLIQIERCPKQMISKVGDILNSGYADEQFDIIASPFFFHHVVYFGFDAFLREFYRVLKPKGKLVIMEPSIFHPLCAFTRPIKKIFNNPFKEVEDEGPFRPKLMLNALKRTGFTSLEFCAATFSHMSFYIPLAKIVNWITKPLLNKWPFKLFGWLILFWAEKDN